MAKRSPVGGVLFAVFFLGMAGLFIVIGARNALHQAQRLRTYVPVPAQILTSDITSHHTSKGDRFSAQIRYAYTVDNARYTSSTLAPIDGSSSSSRSTAQDLVDAYPVGTTTTAYRSPTDPSQAFLLHQLRFVPYVFMLFPMIHFEIGLAVLLFSLGAGSTPQRAAGICVIMSLAWDAVGVAAFGHFLLVGGSLWWKPLLVLALYGGLGLCVTVLSWRKWSSLTRAAISVALSDQDNPYRLTDSGR